MKLKEIKEVITELQKHTYKDIRGTAINFSLVKGILKIHEKEAEQHYKRRLEEFIKWYNKRYDYKRTLEEFVEWNVKDVVGNDPKAIKDSLKRVEQFMKEKND